MIKLVKAPFYVYDDEFSALFPLKEGDGTSLISSTRQFRSVSDYKTDRVGIFDEKISISGQNSFDHVENYGVVFDCTTQVQTAPIGIHFSEVLPEGDGHYQTLSYYNGIDTACIGRIFNENGQYYANVQWIQYSYSEVSSYEVVSWCYYRRAQNYASHNDAIPVSGWNDPSWFKKIYQYPMSGRRFYSSRLKGDAVITDSVIRSLSVPYPEFDLVNWGQLAMSAVENVGFQSNGIAYIKDLAELGSFVSNSAKEAEKVGLKNISMFENHSSLSVSNTNQLKLLKGNLKYAAGLYLSIHYGYKLFLLDTQELLEYFSEEHGQTAQATSVQSLSRPDGTQTNRLTICYEKNARLKSTLDKVTREIDLDLSLAKAWDLTPWSFVVDWGLNLSDTFSELDSAYALANVHKIKYAIETRTYRSNVHKPTGYAGSLYVERYTRVPTADVMFTGINLPQPGNPSNHWFEAGALFVSNS